MQIVLKTKANLLGIENPIDYYIMQQGNQFVKFPAYSIIHIKRANPIYDKNITTQGLGLYYRKEFDNFYDLFNIKKKKMVSLK
jgi:hypothetical protein